MLVATRGAVWRPQCTITFLSCHAMLVRGSPCARRRGGLLYDGALLSRPFSQRHKQRVPGTSNPGRTAEVRGFARPDSPPLFLAPPRPTISLESTMAITTELTTKLGLSVPVVQGGMQVRRQRSPPSPAHPPPFAVGRHAASGQRRVECRRPGHPHRAHTAITGRTAQGHPAVQSDAPTGHPRPQSLRCDRRQHHSLALHQSAGLPGVCEGGVGGGHPHL